MENENITTKQSLTLTERKTLSLDNVKKIDSFDANEFLLDTSDGYVHVKGKDLSIGTMNMESGLLTINGLINQITYLGKSKEKQTIESHPQNSDDLEIPNTE